MIDQRDVDAVSNRDFTAEFSQLTVTEEELPPMFHAIHETVTRTGQISGDGTVPITQYIEAHEAAERHLAENLRNRAVTDIRDLKTTIKEDDELGDDEKAALMSPLDSTLEKLDTAFRAVIDAPHSLV